MDFKALLLKVGWILRILEVNGMRKSYLFLGQMYILVRSVSDSFVLLPFSWLIFPAFSFPSFVSCNILIQSSYIACST